MSELDRLAAAHKQGEQVAAEREAERAAGEQRHTSTFAAMLGELAERWCATKLAGEIASLDPVAVEVTRTQYRSAWWNGFRLRPDRYEARARPSETVELLRFSPGNGNTSHDATWPSLFIDRTGGVWVPHSQRTELPGYALRDPDGSEISITVRRPMEIAKLDSEACSAMRAAAADAGISVPEPFLCVEPAEIRAVYRPGLNANVGGLKVFRRADDRFGSSLREDMVRDHIAATAARLG